MRLIDLLSLADRARLERVRAQNMHLLVAHPQSVGVNDIQWLLNIVDRLLRSEEE